MNISRPIGNVELLCKLCYHFRGLEIPTSKQLPIDCGNHEQQKQVCFVPKELKDCS